jgi:biotin transport system substrate-specific component
VTATHRNSGTFRRVRSRDLVHIALFAAVTAVLGLVPAVNLGPIPITAQTLGVMLAGSVVGARRGFLSQLLFLALVAVGLPLLPGGRGGLSVFAGPTAGYLLSWPVAALVIGLITERVWRRYNLGWGILANVLGGMVLIYAFGVPVSAAVLGASLGTTLAGALIFLPGDLVKAVVAAAVAVQVRRSYPVIEPPDRAVAGR